MKSIETQARPFVTLNIPSISTVHDIKKTPFQFKVFQITKMIYFSLVPPVIRRKSSSASAGGGSPGSKSLHLSPLSNNSERHPRKSQTLFTFPDPGPLSAGSGTRDIYNIKSIVQVSMWACKKKKEYT